MLLRGEQSRVSEENIILSSRVVKEMIFLAKKHFNERKKYVNICAYWWENSKVQEWLERVTRRRVTGDFVKREIRQLL